MPPRIERLLPFLRWPRPSVALLRGEAMAGLTVGLMAVPQGVAYAQLAGMPLVTGIYASMLPALIAVLFSASTRVSVGPTALTCLLIYASLTPLATPGSPQWVELAVWLALMSGGLQVALGAARFGWLLNLVNSPVLMAFTQGAAVLIISSQLPALLGLRAGWAGLSAATQLEHWDIHLSYGHTDVLLNRPAVAPVGLARTNTDIFRALAARMGFADPCFSEDDETLCRLAFGDAVPFDELLEKGFATLPIPDAPFAQGGFPTPSGRCEFFSARLAAQGLDGLPDHVPNHEPAGSDHRYPLAMISPPARNFLNSTFVNVQSLRDIEGEPVLEISEADAVARGIATGDVVRVFNDRGCYHCKATVSSRARSGVVNGLGIWWRKLGLNGTNVNEVTSQKLTDLGRAPVFYDCLVEVAGL